MRILLFLLVATLVGCAEQPRQANFRPPRPDELRPGDIAPPPGPFVDSKIPPGVQPPSPRPQYYQPMPAPYQVPAYQMQIPQQQYQPPTNCTTRYVGSTAYTNCF